MVVPWKVARLFVRCAEYLCRCHQSEELCLLQLKRTKNVVEFMLKFVAATLSDRGGN